ncbi:DUF4238 domain-containing protein [Parasphingorhabdus sp.]|uniref:DUF4238 domain-containing protein n=1 Tax=Parasphingorhabdus sp. TaxID=2709688 RepID=UPI003A8DD6A8
MSQPKRHHWWPQLQSGYWTDENGLIHVTKKDGSTFTAPPSKVGVEGELYTRFEISGRKDLTIEKWFAAEIENPFVKALDRLLSLDGIETSPLLGRRRDKELELRELGFIIPTKLEKIPLSGEHRAAINSYLAALLVRNPKYLAKLAAFHDKNGLTFPEGLPRNQEIKVVALNNMLSVFEIYRDEIAKADLGLLLVMGENELLFSDAGISAQEPWKAGPIPFDIHAPLTPRLALEVLPIRQNKSPECFIMRMNNQGTARMNRIILEDAERFVFSRQTPPLKFIIKHFGKPAPKSIAHRVVNGKLETKFDHSRDRL